MLSPGDPQMRRILLESCAFAQLLRGRWHPVVAPATRDLGCGWSYCPMISANISGATMVASDSIMYLGVSMPSLPQVIFSLGTAPE